MPFDTQESTARLLFIDRMIGDVVNEFEHLSYGECAELLCQWWAELPLADRIQYYSHKPKLELQDCSSSTCPYIVLRSTVNK